MRTPPGDSTQQWAGVNERDLGETGLREAIERLRDRLTPQPADDPLIPLAEALSWCYSLEEYHRARLPNYFALRDGTLGGDTLAGLIYARGLLTHGGLVATAELVTLPPSLVRTQMVGHRGGGVTHVRPVVSTLEWKPLLSLPAPGKPEKHWRDLRYQRHVERKPVLRPLESAERFLEALP